MHMMYLCVPEVPTRHRGLPRVAHDWRLCRNMLPSEFPHAFRREYTPVLSGGARWVAAARARWPIWAIAAPSSVVLLLLFWYCSSRFVLLMSVCSHATPVQPRLHVLSLCVLQLPPPPDSRVHNRPAVYCT